MQQDPSWRRVHPQVRSAAVLGLVFKPYAAVQLFVPQVFCSPSAQAVFSTATVLTGVSLLLQHWFFRNCQKHNQAAARAGGGIIAMCYCCNQIDAL